MPIERKLKLEMTMAVLLNLPVETERLLKEKAARAGQTLEDYLMGLAEREARESKGTRPGQSPLTIEQWSAEWRAWGNADRKLPAGIVIDDSRESIYAGRGE
jgi:hypothetical protein